MVFGRLLWVKDLVAVVVGLALGFGACCPQFAAGQEGDAAAEPRATVRDRELSSAESSPADAPSVRSETDDLESASDAAAGGDTDEQAGDTAEGRETERDAPSTLNGELAATIATLTERVAGASALSTIERDEADGDLEAASQALEATAAIRRQIRELERELAAAPAEIERLSEIVSRPLPQPTLPRLATIAEWETELARAEADEASASVAVREVAARVGLQTERRRSLPAALEELRTQLAEVETRMASDQADQPELVDRARTARLQAEQLRLQAEIELLQLQARTYEATSRLLALQRDSAIRNHAVARERVDRVQRELSQRRSTTAAARVRQLRDRLADATEQDEVALASSLSLAERNLALVDRLETIEQRLEAGDRMRLKLLREFATVRRRAEGLSLSPAVGSLLRNYRRALAPARTLADELTRLDDGRLLEDAIGELQAELVAWRTQRDRLLLAPVASDGSTELVALRRDLLADTIDSGEKLLDRLIRLRATRAALSQTVDEQTQFVAEQVLWVRDAEPMGLATLREFPGAATHLFSRVAWREAAAALWNDVRQRPVWGLLAGLLVVGSLALRSRAEATLKSCCEAARRPTVTSLRPTYRAIGASLVLATLLPAAAWLVGWRLSAVTPSGSVANAFGMALREVSLVGVVLQLVRVVMRPHGLGNSHFAWPPEATRSVRWVLRVLLIVALPAGVLVLTARRAGDEATAHSLGRVAFLIAAAAFVWAGYRLFRRASPVMEAAKARRGRSLIARLRYLWAALAIGGPVVLAAMAVEGHYYTALMLAVRAIVTAAGITLVLFLQAMLDRTLLITYRRLAMRRAQEKRAERAAQQEALGEEGEPSDVIAAETDEPEVPLIEVSQQTRTIIRVATVVALLGLVWVSWADVLPALEWVGRISIVPDAIAAEAGLPADASIDARNVTLADVFKAFVVAVLTFLAARNLPGLLEIAVLQRLPLDAGARYAAAAIARYAIAILGLVVAFRLIGIGWSSVQWLVAAVSVGLGFGLQEIFANFVSGLILLFERPIRVGDTVTINDITGTVTRIRIRATTVLDWDNRELVMPNKDFVTGNLINWTLSNPNVRVVQTIGIAYGSDTELATRLLKEAAVANSRILDEPAPLVVFTEFGDNSLIFELRFFVTGLQAFRTIKHELNLAIDRAFRDAEIEISFPQRDLHVRSIDRDAIRELTAATERPESYVGEM